MNGIPHLVHLRSFSLFGLSDIKLVFDDESENDWNRERTLERLAQVQCLPGTAPNGHRLESCWPDLLLYSAQHESAIRPDGTQVS